MGTFAEYQHLDGTLTLSLSGGKKDDKCELRFSCSPREYEWISSMIMGGAEFEDVVILCSQLHLYPVETEPPLTPATTPMLNRLYSDCQDESGSFGEGVIR